MTIEDNSTEEEYPAKVETTIDDLNPKDDGSVHEELITRNLEAEYIPSKEIYWKNPPKRSGLASGLFWGILIGVFMVSSLWYYLHRNTYNYEVRRSTSAFTKPADIQEVLAKIEPATVAISVGGGANILGGGAGTGFIYSSDGYVLTNNHVIEGGNKIISVILNDGRTLDAKLLGVDPVEDLAVLKIEGTDFPAVKLGSSDATIVGDDVIAIGNALALEGGLSVTRGIVSGKDRVIATELGTKLRGIIQTDAAINRGNSGGPLKVK